MTAIPRRTLQLLGTILLVAVVLRAVNYAALADGPCLLPHGVSDMAFFVEWRDRIAGGDYLTDDALHPLHSWHKKVALEHFTRNPGALAGADLANLSPSAFEARAEALWDGWYGGKTLHQEPLYPYALALVRGCCGRDLAPVHVLQMLLGLATVVLLFALTRRYFGDAAGLVAAGLATLCGPLLFFELHLLRATPIAFASLALAWLFERTAEDPTRRRWLLLGIGTGVATALKSHFLVFGLAAAGFLLWPKRRDPAACGRGFGLLAAGSMFGFLPVVIRNLWVGAPAFSVSSVGPVTVANSNHAAYGGHGWAEGKEALATLAAILPEHHGSLFGAWAAAVGTHDGFGSYLGLLWTKLGFALSWAEIPNNVNYYFAKLHSTTLAVLPVTFTVVATTALLGLVAILLAPRDQRRIPVPLLVLALLSFAQLVVFYNLGRFRVALIAALLPLSANGIVWTLRQLRDRNLRHLLPAAVAALALLFFVQRPLPPDMTLVGSSSYGNAMNHYYRPQWDAAVKSADWRRALAVIGQAIATRPGYLDRIDRQTAPANRTEFNTTGIYAELYLDYARALRESGRAAEARSAESRGQDLAAVFQRVQKMLQK